MVAWWNQIAETAVHGLQITVVGMALVFFTLGLVILSVVLLTRLPGLRVKEEPKTEQVSSVSLQPENVGSGQATMDEGLAQVAAIALAVLRSRRAAVKRPRKGPTESGWKQYGRANQLGL